MRKGCEARVERLERRMRRLAWLVCLIGAGAMVVLMMGVTVIDVLLRPFALAIPGAYEIVTLGMRLIVPLALPYTFLTGGHVVVEVVAEALPQALQKSLVLFGWCASLAVMGLLAWRALERAQEVAEYGEVTSDLAIPVVWYWAPLILGSGLCIPTLIVMSLAAFVRLQGGPHE